MDKDYALKELQYALEFTAIYKSYNNKALREAKCLKLQTPHLLVPIETEDLIAGRMCHGFAGFSPQYGGLYTYFFHEDLVKKALISIGKEVDETFINLVHGMIDFWREECTCEKVNKSYEETFGYRMPSTFHEPGIANCDVRLAGTNPDLDKLIRLGIPGLKEEIYKYKAASKDTDFYDALEISLETIRDACSHYEKQAILLMKEAEESRKKELEELASTLNSIQYRKPSSFKEGLQLFWIYAVISDLMNYGRMDVYLGDLYSNDIKNGSLTEEEAIRYLESLYNHMAKIGKVHDSRVIIGGKGRRNEDNANLLAMTIMETSRRVKGVVPQLTLRYYNGISREVFDKALQVNAEGCTFPIIYSDDTNIPAVMKAYDISEDEAMRYLPFGCGEYVLEGLSTGSPNNGVNLLKALELALHRGYDYIHNIKSGPDTTPLDNINSFEDLWNAYCKQLEPEIIKVAWHKKLNYSVAAEQASYLHLSLLMDDCISRGKALLDGGVRYLNASSEIYGLISTSDSFTAIKKCVFEDRKFSIKDLVSMIDVDFDGFERERQFLIDAPKYGNDDDYADEIAKRVFNHVAYKTIEAGNLVGLNKYLIVSVNNSMNSEWGCYCLASPCGRKKGQPMANGNGPSLGADRNGITALLNSMSKFDPSLHVGVIHNIRFTKEMFKTSYEKIKFLLETFYNNNGVQTNISVIGKDDLEQAMLHPELYQNLIVRIGGFSARFVDLTPVVQNDILLRTTYES